MTVKHQPATPLPFTALKDSHVADVNGRDVAMVLGPKQNRAQQVAYLAHAANAYPKLVAALRKVLHLAEMEGPVDETPVQSDARALLRELGEDQ